MTKVYFEPQLCKEFQSMYIEEFLLLEILKYC